MLSAPCHRHSAPSKSAISIFVRHASIGRPGANAAADPQKEAIRRMLYPANLRNKPTPTGTWRPDVARTLRRAIPSAQAHETIERAWLLYQRHNRKQRKDDLKRKFDHMHQAMAELEVLSPELFKEANRPEKPRERTAEDIEAVKTMKANERKAFEGRVRGLFPREMRLPTETPPRLGWNYEWTPPKRSNVS